MPPYLRRHDPPTELHSRRRARGRCRLLSRYRASRTLAAGSPVFVQAPQRDPSAAPSFSDSGSASGCQVTLRSNGFSPAAFHPERRWTIVFHFTCALGKGTPRINADRCRIAKMRDCIVRGSGPTQLPNVADCCAARILNRQGPRSGDCRVVTRGKSYPQIFYMLQLGSIDRNYKQHALKFRTQLWRLSRSAQILPCAETSIKQCRGGQRSASKPLASREEITCQTPPCRNYVQAPRF